MNPIPAWAASVKKYGFLMGKNGEKDPREKTTEKKRKKLSDDEFAAWFDELVEGQGTPFASAFAK